ncbi:hypothetical protein ASE98_13105 [Pseudomonas sp. Leaf48]|jgi:hypothetical protein|nr:hypothetical protein ASE98_13105 [Pseudomonas sp. Leaf48]
MGRGQRSAGLEQQLRFDAQKDRMVYRDGSQASLGAFPIGREVCEQRSEISGCEQKCIDLRYSSDGHVGERPHALGLFKAEELERLGRLIASGDGGTEMDMASPKPSAPSH